MDELTYIRTFVSVVKAGSFSAVANQASSVSTVARQINALEREVGVQLLNRSTRGLSLTEAGRLYFDRVSPLADELENAKSEVRSLREEVKGLLRVSLRISAGALVIVPALPRLLSKYPDLSVDVALTDERRDLVTNNIDVALWMGHLGDANVIAKRVSPTCRIVCASPDYLARHGMPRVPQDLVSHSCLLYTAPNYTDLWEFVGPDGKETVKVRGNVQSENGVVLFSAALAGLGLHVAHEWMVRDMLAQGRLVRVLDDFVVNPRAADADFYAVYPPSRRLSRKVKAFVDFLADTFTEER